MDRKWKIEKVQGSRSPDRDSGLELWQSQTSMRSRADFVTPSSDSTSRSDTYASVRGRQQEEKCRGIFWLSKPMQSGAPGHVNLSLPFVPGQLVTLPLPKT
jgi:hypothetical protein